MTGKLGIRRLNGTPQELAELDAMQIVVEQSGNMHAAIEMHATTIHFLTQSFQGIFNREPSHDERIKIVRAATELVGSFFQVSVN